MKIKRQGCFETNSSSAHSFTIKRKDSDYSLSRKENVPTTATIISANTDESHHSLQEKLNYLVTYIAEEVARRNDIDLDSNLTDVDKDAILKGIKDNTKFTILREELGSVFSLSQIPDLEIVFEEPEDSYGLYYGFSDEDRSNGCLDILFHNDTLLYWLLASDCNYIYYGDY